MDMQIVPRPIEPDEPEERDPFYLLNSALAEARRERLDAPMADEAEEEAAVYKAALARLFSVHQNIGQNILLGLWTMYSRGLITLDDTASQNYDPNQFEAWCDDTFGNLAEPHYVAQLARVVVRIFGDVHAKFRTKDAYIVAGQRLTVEMLLKKEGLVAKLTHASNTYSLPTLKPEDRLLLLTKIYSGTRKQVAIAAESIINGGSPLKLPYRKTFSGGVGLDGLTSYHFDNLNAQQSKLLEVRLTGLLQHTFGEGLN